MTVYDIDPRTGMTVQPGDPPLRELTHEECPKKPGYTHHLRPVNEGRGRGGMVQRCAWCGKTEGALRSEAPGNIIPRREAAPRRTTRKHWR